ncbi:MAG: hypothetical protein MJ245_00695 [Clostridia bacterium]|nr:hypothetical protein [Clostridia bacterium]
MDLILLLMVTIAPVIVGNIIQGDTAVKTAKRKNANSLVKDGYVVTKYGNFDYAYKRV